MGTDHGLCLLPVTSGAGVRPGLGRREHGKCSEREAALRGRTLCGPGPAFPVRAGSGRQALGETTCACSLPSGGGHCAPLSQERQAQETHSVPRSPGLRWSRTQTCRSPRPLDSATPSPAPSLLPHEAPDTAHQGLATVCGLQCAWTLKGQRPVPRPCSVWSRSAVPEGSLAGA